MKNYFAFFLIFLLFISCSPTGEDKTLKKNVSIKVKLTPTQIKYSRFFSIEYADAFKLVHIFKDIHQKDTLNSFLLLPHDVGIPEKYQSLPAIRIPLKNVACLSSLYVAYLEELGLLDKLAAVDNEKYIYSKKAREFIEKNNIAEIGSNNSANMEKLAAINPDAVFTYWEQGFAISEKLKELNISPILVVDHMENTPLGRAEWIKLMAALFNEEEKANTFFDTLQANYESLLSHVSDKAQIYRPTVLLGTQLSDAWYVPGGNSYMARLIKDAEGYYIWNYDTTTGSIAVNFETVLSKAKDADIWLNVYQHRSLDDLIRTDNRYSFFKAFKNKQVYNNNHRVNAYGGNDFWESGLLHPDLLLKDLIKIIRPGEFPEYEPIYYQQLK